MKISKLDGFKILKDEGSSFENYISFLEEGRQELGNDNLVLDLQDLTDMDNEKLLTLLPYSREHKRGKKSFVVVTTDVDVDEVPEILSVVPTIGEAEDLIQMEEIERDLGF